MLTAIFAASSVLVPPAVIPDQAQYPSKAVREGRTAAALIDIVVDPDGNPIQCHTREVFGDESFGNGICDLQGSLRFQPARNTEGQQTYGIARVFMKYVLVGSDEGLEIKRLDMPGITVEVIGGRIRSGRRPPDIDKFLAAAGQPQTLERPDATLQVSTLPNIEGDHVDVIVGLQIDEAGSVAICAGPKGADINTGADGLVDIACNQLLGSKVADPLVVDGPAISYVRSMAVRFTTAEID